MKLFAYSILFLCLISLAQAVDPGQQNTPLDIVHSVRVNDGLPNGATCNITALNPKGNILVNFKAMTYNSASQTFNYTLPPSNTTFTGNYCYDISCFQGGLNKTESFCVPVTPSGTQPSEQESSIYIFVGIIAIFIFSVFTFLFFKIDGKNGKNQFGEIIAVNYMKQFKIVCGLIAYMVLVWLPYIAWGITYTYLEFAGIAKFFYFVHRILFVGSWLILLCYFLIALMMFWKDKNLEKMLARGFTDGKE